MHFNGLVLFVFKKWFSTECLTYQSNVIFSDDVF
jgi:hypothetical protein